MTTIYNVIQLDKSWYKQIVTFRINQHLIIIICFCNLFFTLDTTALETQGQNQSQGQLQCHGRVKFMVFSLIRVRARF